MPRLKKKPTEADVADAIVEGVKAAIVVTDTERSEFRNELDVVMGKFSSDFPFWCVLSEHVSVALTKTAVPTAGMTKDGLLLFNINFINHLREQFGKRNKKVYYKKLLFLVAHEVAHFAFQHGYRCGSRDHTIFNHAADYAINLLLHYQFEGLEDYFIEGGLLNVEFDGMTAEEIYEKIKDDEKFQDNPLEGDIFAEGGEGDSDIVRDRKVPLPDSSGKSSDQVRQDLGDYISKALHEAFAVAKQQGNMPGNFERMISRLLKPQVDWLTALRQKLRFGCSRVEKRDVTWSNPNRRFIGMDIVMPSSIGPESPKIVYAVDTSGSMSEKDLTQAVAELEDIRKRFNAKVYFMDCDAQVHGSRWIHPNEPLPSLSGGGGTDFIPVFNHLITNRIKPDYCVFFTDGCGSYPDEKPPFNTLWVMTSEVRPPFGDVIRVNVPYEG